jgi:hypothetical protein
LRSGTEFDDELKEEDLSEYCKKIEISVGFRYFDVPTGVRWPVQPYPTKY